MKLKKYLEKNTWKLSSRQFRLPRVPLANYHIFPTCYLVFMSKYNTWILLYALFYYAKQIICLIHRKSYNKQLKQLTIAKNFLIIIKISIVNQWFSIHNHFYWQVSSEVWSHSLLNIIWYNWLFLIFFKNWLQYSCKSISFS